LEALREPTIHSTRISDGEFNLYIDFKAQKLKASMPPSRNKSIHQPLGHNFLSFKPVLGAGYSEYLGIN
jgi:hypothetical protein